MAYSRESKQGTGSFRKKLRKLGQKGKSSQAAYLREKRRKEMGYSSWGIGNPRKVKGRSTTLKNMASVTIQKLPNGVVKITGRKMAGRKSNPRRGAYVISAQGMEFQRTYRTKTTAVKAAKRFRKQGYSRLKIRKR